MFKMLSQTCKSVKLNNDTLVFESDYGNIEFSCINFPRIDEEIDSSDELEITRLMDLFIIPDIYRPILRSFFRDNQAGFALRKREGYALWVADGNDRRYYRIYCTHPKVPYRTTESPVPVMRSSLCA